MVVDIFDVVLCGIKIVVCEMSMTSGIRPYNGQLSTEQGRSAGHAEFIAQRYGHFWHNLDKAVQAPPSNSSQAQYQKTVPWSGNGGFTSHIATDKVMRVWVEPWNAERPFMSYTDSPGTSMIGPNNSSSNADRELSFPASSNLETHAYQNVGMVQSGFLLDSRAYFMGGFIEGVAYVDDTSRGTINIIGQNEVRGIGVGPLEELNVNRDIGQFPDDWLHDPNATDYDISSAANTLGGMKSLKTAHLVVNHEGSNTQKAFFSIPIVPPKGGCMQMSENMRGGANSGSTFLVPVTKVVTYTTSHDFCDRTSGNDSGQIVASSSTAATGGQTSARPFTFTSAEGDHTGVSPADAYPYGTLPADVVYNTDGKKRLVRATQQPMQSLIAGYPLIEAAAHTGTMTVEIQFKLFYNVVVPRSHPMYDSALLGSYVDISEIAEYQHHAAPCAGFSLKSREDSIVDMKKQHVNLALQRGKQTKHHLMHVVSNVSATNEHVHAKLGLGKPVTNDENWLAHTQRESILHGQPIIQDLAGAGGGGEQRPSIRHGQWGGSVGTRGSKRQKTELFDEDDLME